MLSVVIRLVPIQFVAVLFMLFVLGGFAVCCLSCCMFLRASTSLDTAFILLHLFNKYFPALGWLLLYLFTDVFIY